MNYKELFGEWAYNFYEQTGSDPSMKDCESFRDSWISDIEALIDSEREAQD